MGPTLRKDMTGTIILVRPKTIGRSKSPTGDVVGLRLAPTRDGQLPGRNKFSWRLHYAGAAKLMDPVAFSKNPL